MHYVAALAAVGSEGEGVHSFSLTEAVQHGQVGVEVEELVRVAWVLSLSPLYGRYVLEVDLLLLMKKVSFKNDNGTLSVTYTNNASLRDATHAYRKA